MKKFIGFVVGLVFMAGLFVVPVKANTIAGVFADMESAYYEAESKYHTAGICSILGELLLIEPETSANPWQENYILPVEPEPEPDMEAEEPYTEEEYAVGAVVEAEAGNEPEEGQRAVADTVWNRKEHEDFPDTTHGVIHQKNQYETVSNGRIYQVEVGEDTLQLVREEREQRSYPSVLYFRTKHYFSFGKPCLKIGNHYFSTQ